VAKIWCMGPLALSGVWVLMHCFLVYDFSWAQ
jgi:hypothetical protein